MPAVAARARRRPRDRGAVATVVAVLLAGGVLLGFAAIVIDIGFIYAEREELVTGADAAALAVGRECANDRAKCSSEAEIVSLVSSYANANASDGAANVLEVCGRLPGRLGSCPAAPNNLTRCLGEAPPDPVRYVEVRLSTKLDDGRLLFPPMFSQTLAGGGAGAGTAVAACARVSWERINAIGLTVSTCELADAPTPDDPDYGPGDEHVVNFLDGHHGECDRVVGGGPWGHADHAGILDANSRCLTDVPDDAQAWGDEPIDPPYRMRCTSALNDLIATGQPVWVLVHDAHRHDGTRTAYRIVSVAKFVVTGYYFGDEPDEQRESRLTDSLPCEAIGRDDERSCISGVFVGESRPLYTIADDAIVRLIG
jgi:hypothetical protein